MLGTCALSAVLYIAPLLLNAPLTDPDEGLHAAISQEMVERGDWIVPRLLGRAFLDKPILFFWAQAASLRAFGMSTAAARLPGMLLALLGIATTAWLAHVLFGGTRRTASASPVPWIAAACYATMVLPFLLAQAPVHDIALVPLTNAAIGLLWRSRDPGSGIRDPLLAAIALGVSILAKGLEGVAIVGVGYSVFLLLTRTLTWRLVAQGAAVVTIAVFIALPWYVAVNAREAGYLQYYFIDRHLLGFATDTQRHGGQPWWFYLPVVIAGGLPWLLFVRVTRPEPSHTLLWTWLIGAIVLLSLSQSKAVTYILPAIPAVAILAAVSAPTIRHWRVVSMGTAVVYALALFAFGPPVAQTHSARDLAGYFNASGRVPATMFVFDQRVSFVYYLRPDVRRQLRKDQIRSVSVEQLAAMQPFPHDAVVLVPADLAQSRLSQIPQLSHARRDVAGRYLVVSPDSRAGVSP